MLVVEKSEWEDGEIDYNVSVQDSRYDHNYTTLWGRLKSAMKLLFGKPVYYSDVYIDEPERFIEFVKQLNVLCHYQGKNNGVAAAETISKPVIEIV